MRHSQALGRVQRWRRLLTQGLVFSILVTLVVADAARGSLPPADIPQNPFMAPNGRNSLHNDAYSSDTYDQPGPVGTVAVTRKNARLGVCGGVTFDSKGRIVTLCLATGGWRLVMLDPISLQTMAVLPLPPGNLLAVDDPIALFVAGAYLYIDASDRIIIGVSTPQIWQVEETEGPTGPGFQLARTFDLSGAIRPNDTLVALQPDWNGLIWFGTIRGVLGTIDPQSGRVQSRMLRDDERITNSFAADESGGVYVVSDYAMYRFDATSTGVPRVTWRETYERTNRHKEGAVQDGSGTTPTPIGRRFIAIGDYADPRMHVVVYRRKPKISGQRTVCAKPVFTPYRGHTELSFIGYRNSIVAQNNYPLTPFNPVQGIPHEGGITRIDIKRRGGRTSCRTVWTSDEMAPTAMPKLSTASGLVYAWTKEPDPDGDRFYVTGLDFVTGRVTFKVHAATGFPWGIAATMNLNRPDQSGGCAVYMAGGLGMVRATGPCPRRVGTRITKGPKRTVTTARARAKVTFHFRSDVVGSGFQCKLRGKGALRRLRRFRSCKSPRTTELEATRTGRRYLFRVRAIDGAGNVDPTPATRRFRLVRTS